MYIYHVYIDTNTQNAFRTYFIHIVCIIYKYFLYKQKFLLNIYMHVHVIINIHSTLIYVTLEHKTSLKCKFFEIEMYASSE